MYPALVLAHAESGDDGDREGEPAEGCQVQVACHQAADGTHRQAAADHEADQVNVFLPSLNG